MGVISIKMTYSQWINIGKMFIKKAQVENLQVDYGDVASEQKALDENIIKYKAARDSNQPTDQYMSNIYNAARAMFVREYGGYINKMIKERGIVSHDSEDIFHTVFMNSYMRYLRGEIVNRSGEVADLHPGAYATQLFKTTISNLLSNIAKSGMNKEIPMSYFDGLIGSNSDLSSGGGAGFPASPARDRTRSFDSTKIDPTQNPREQSSHKELIGRLNERLESIEQRIQKESVGNGDPNKRRRGRPRRDGGVTGGYSHLLYKVYNLYTKEQMTYSQIAEQLNIPPDAAHSLVVRISAIIRQAKDGSDIRDLFKDLTAKNKNIYLLAKLQKI